MLRYSFNIDTTVAIIESVSYREVEETLWIERSCVFEGTFSGYTGVATVAL